MDFFTLALEDARARNAAVCELIRFTDQQAMALLSLYCTLSIACVSGSAAIFSSGLEYQAAARSLVASAVFFIFASACCFRVLATAKIFLPGSDPKFWMWALKYRVEGEFEPLSDGDVLSAYLEAVAQNSAQNDAVNATGALWLGYARLMGLSAPVAGGLAALTVLY